MIGFFEYQYLKYKKGHLENLVALAKIDGHFHDKEKDFLFDIGLKYGLKPRQIEEIFLHTGSSQFYIPSSHEQKMGVLFDTVGLMMADEVIEDSEMAFCKEMALEMKYDTEILNDMIDAIERKTINSPEDWELFLDQSKKYLRD